MKNWFSSPGMVRFEFSTLFHPRKKYRTMSDTNFRFSKGTKLFCLSMKHLRWNVPQTILSIHVAFKVPMACSSLSFSVFNESGLVVNSSFSQTQSEIRAYILNLRKIQFLNLFSRSVLK